MKKPSLMADPELSCWEDPPETGEGQLDAHCRENPQLRPRRYTNPRNARSAQSTIRKLKRDLRLAEVIRQQCEGLSHRINKLEALAEPFSQRSVVVPIQDLGPLPVEITHPILAVVQEEDGVFVASFFDANLNASGESQLDAVEMLKDVIVSSFRLFLEKRGVLGEEPRRQLAVLEHFIRLR